jgi:hypothetical protein
MNPRLSAAVPSVARLLYTHNPFYLIGTLLVLFGMQQSLGREPDLPTSGFLVALLASYALVLSAIAVLVIRVGQVWDDARTLLLVIVLLFFMLSTSLDFHLLFTLEAPWPGTWMLAGAGMFSILLSEGLLSVLRLRLPLRYRGPYYLMLVLLFGYPIALGWLNYHSYYAQLGSALLAFPLLAALALLSLLPAARVPAHREGKTGTPWIWPYYPWSLFVFLTIGVAIRSWWLTIAFEPAKGADAYFQPYFLLPLVLAWAALVLEMGIVRHSPGGILAGMCLPLVALVIGFPGRGNSPLESEFLSRLTAAIGSPPQLAVGGLALFYGWAWLRRVVAAEGLLYAATLLLSVVGPQTLDRSSLQAPQPAVIAAVVAALAVQAVRLDSSARAMLACAIFGGGLHFAELQFGGEALGFWQWHAPLLGFLAIPAVFNDELARELRQLAWKVVPAFALAAAAVYPWIMPALDSGILFSYLTLAFIVSGALWLRLRRAEPLGGLLATLGASLLLYVEQGYLLLAQTALGGGRAWFAAGGTMVLAAVGISLIKMGAAGAARRWLEGINRMLGGAECEPP